MAAVCPDAQAKAAADSLALSFYGQDASLYRGAMVQVRHHPSGNKEVASYVKTDDKHYTVFSLVVDGCRAQYRKRTRRAR